MGGRWANDRASGRRNRQQNPRWGEDVKPDSINGMPVPQ
jgi:hypothetical protein